MPKGARHAGPGIGISLRVFCLGCGQPVHIGVHKLRSMGELMLEFVPANCPYCGKALKAWTVDDISVRGRVKGGFIPLNPVEYSVRKRE